MESVDSVTVTRKRISPPASVGDKLAESVNEARKLEYSLELLAGKISVLESQGADGPVAAAREARNRLELSLRRTQEQIRLLRGQFYNGVPAGTVLVAAPDSPKKQKTELRLASAVKPVMKAGTVHGEAEDAFSLSEPKYKSIDKATWAKAEKARAQKILGMRQELASLERRISKAQTLLARLHAQYVFVATRQPEEIREFIADYNDDADVVRTLASLRRDLINKIERHEQAAARARSRVYETSSRTDLSAQAKEQLSKSFTERAVREEARANDIQETKLVYVEEELAAWQGKSLTPSGEYQDRPERVMVRLLRESDEIAETGDGEDVDERKKSAESALSNAAEILPDDVLISTFNTSHGTVPALSQLPPILRRGGKRLKSVQDYTTLLASVRGRVTLAERSLREHHKRRANVEAELARWEPAA